MWVALFLAIALANGVQDCRAHVVPEFGEPIEVFGIPIPVDGAAVKFKCQLKE